MPTKKKAVTAYLAEEEFENVKTWAERAGLTLSTFIRKVSQGSPSKALSIRCFVWNCDGFAPISDAWADCSSKVWWRIKGRIMSYGDF